MTLYPALPRARRAFILADVGMLLWLLLCLYAGTLVHDAVMRLATFGHAAINTGHEARITIAQVQQLLASLPLGLGPTLRDSLTPLYRLPAAVISSGQSEVASVSHLAMLLGVLVAVIPLLAGLLLYLPWRVRKTRGLRDLQRLLERSGNDPAGAVMQVLAARALYALPYADLLRYSPNPVAEWQAGEYQNLARAALAAEGIPFDRYLRRHGGDPHPTPAITTARDKTYTYR